MRRPKPLTVPTRAEQSEFFARAVAPETWTVWVHGGQHNEDGSNTAFIRWPRGLALTIPARFVLMTEAAFNSITASNINSGE